MPVPAFVIKALTNPLWWMTSDLRSHIGNANAPTLVQFDSEGFASPAGNWPLSQSEVISMNEYNSNRSMHGSCKPRSG